MGKNMGESAGKELFPRRKPGTRLFAFYGQKTTEENRVKGAQLVCKSYRKAGLPAEAVGKVKDPSGKKYSLCENAGRLAGALSGIGRDEALTEELARAGYIRFAKDLHALRSFAWTSADYRKRTGIESDAFSRKELTAMAEAVLQTDCLNYRGGSFSPSLCGTSDVNVLFVPRKTAKELKETEGFTVETGSLSGLRKDLIRLKPVMETIAMDLFAGEFGGADRDFYRRVLAAWCALAIAAKEPFVLAEGPKVYRSKNAPKKSSPVKSAEKPAEQSVMILPGSAIPAAVLADARKILPKLSDFGEVDLQFITKRLTEIQEDGMANNDPGRERTVEELIAELMGTAKPAKEAAPAPAPAPEPEPAPAPAPAPAPVKDVAPAPDPSPVDPGWEVTPATGKAAKPVEPEIKNDIEPEWEVSYVQPVAKKPAPVVPEPAPVIPEPAPVIPEPQEVVVDPSYVAPEPMPFFMQKPEEPVPAPAPVIPEPEAIVVDPSYVAPEPMAFVPQTEEKPEEKEPEPIPFYLPETDIPAPVVLPEPEVIPEPAPVIPEPEPVIPEPAPVIPEPEPEPAPAPAPEPAPEPEPAEEPVMDEHEAAVRRRMREILEQNKKKQQEKDDIRRQMEERRLEVARKQEQRRQEILAKRRADYEKLLAEQEDLKKVVEENKNAIMGEKKKKRIDAQRRIMDIEDIILKEYLDLKRGTNDYHTGLTQELY
jgi:hypothetical protein